jgi:hypothetical protein
MTAAFVPVFVVAVGVLVPTWLVLMVYRLMGEDD